MIFIFDLDDTLIDTSGLIIPQASLQSCSILIEGGIQATLEQIMKDRHEMAVGMSHTKIFPTLGKKYGFEKNRTQEQIQDTIDRATKAFYSPVIKNDLPLIEGALDNLKNYSTRFPLYLVTAGLEVPQRNKIEKAHIKDFFKEIFVIASMTEKSKIPAFRKILDLEKCSPESCLSIGNRLSSEIRDAKTCGMQTCYFEFGEHVGEVPQCPEEIPDFTIHHHHELKKICPLPSY